MLRKIESRRIHCEWVDYLRTSRLKKLTWMYTPGHAGVKGNERADQLANEAHMQSGRCMDRADILSAVRTHLSETSEYRYSLNRLLELGVKPGQARQCRLRGRERRYHNQLLMGTISRGTLAWLLQRRTEHVWECPLCDEVFRIT